MKAALEADTRQWLTQDEFEAMCAKASHISRNDLFLQFLHNAGTVFYRKGLFGDRIILDQSWALDAIYAVFHRAKCKPALERQGGRFTRADLARLIWEDAGFAADEQRLFLTMMEQCGICFVHRWQGDETEYVAPELLPPEPPAALADRWDDAAPCETASFHFPLMTDAVLRRLMAEIGSEAGQYGVYWKQGFYVYEAKTRAKALVEQTRNGWSGDITLRTQGGNARELRDRLAAEIERLTGAKAVLPEGTPELRREEVEWKGEYRSNADVAQVCEKLIAELRGIPAGNKHANDYHDAIFRALSLIFDRDFGNGRKEQEINEGRKRIDIVFTNRATAGFFADRKREPVHASYIAAECKNYSNDPKNPELQQLLGRFSPNFGRLGLLVFRTLTDPETLTKRCRDSALPGNGYIIALDDKDVEYLLRARAEADTDKIENFIDDKYLRIIT